MKTEAEMTDSEILWCCHVRGPDDIYAAPDYETALKWADATNALNWRGHTPADYSDCLIKAVPAPYPGSAEEHASQLAESIRQNTPRCELPPDDPDYLPAKTGAQPMGDGSGALFPAATLEPEVADCSPQALMCDP